MSENSSGGRPRGDGERELSPEPLSQSLDKLDWETVDDESFVSEDLSSRLCFTILAHPDYTRVGESSFVRADHEDGPLLLSRLEPTFSRSPAGPFRPLTDPHLSRAPIQLKKSGETWTLESNGTSRVEIDGILSLGITEIPDHNTHKGIVLLLGQGVCLLFHRRPEQYRTAIAPNSLVGENAAMLEVFNEISKLGAVDVPVLIRGETGTGKELVARAIHDASRRANGPFVAVNMATLPPALAASELFGSAKGAFTGSTKSRPGLFKMANSGTLFLDEIGATPAEVQALLLRAIEDRIIRSVGSETGVEVDLRILAATDARLEEAVEDGDFREPLLQRLGTYVIHLPPLRERREDLGTLLYQFLRTELLKTSDRDPLSFRRAQERPWLPAAVVAALALEEWPGNIRQLRNVATRLAVRYRDRESLNAADVIPWLKRQVTVPSPLRESEPLSSPTLRKQSGHKYRDPSDVTEQELVDCLRSNQWQIRPTARALNLSRGSLYTLVERSDKIRKAKDLSAEEIQQAFEASDKKMEAAALLLEVSKEGLKIRMTELGIR